MLLYLHSVVQSFGNDFHGLSAPCDEPFRWKLASPTLLRLKGGVTMSIMITCVIYHFLLAPIATNFYTLENFLCHYIVPLWFLADTLFFDKQGQYKIWDPVVWTILPLLYMIFASF